MFLNAAVFKSMINRAWKGAGLTVGKDEEEFFIEGGYWIVRVKADKLPNKEKAALIECVGEMPAEGEVFKSIKGVGNQFEIPFNDSWNIGRQWELAEIEVQKTGIMIQQKDIMCRILQEESGKCILINEMFNKLIDSKAINFQEEEEPEGPRAITSGGTVVYWKNQTTVLAACTRVPDEKNYEQRFLDTIGQINMNVMENI